MEKRSPYNLIQESLRGDPWRILVACIFCNMTRRMTAEPILWEFFERWPSASSISTADECEIRELIKPLGLSNRRARSLVNLSIEYAKGGWSDPIDLPGVGKYARDAWSIFVESRGKEIPRPNDHALSWYWEWLQTQ